MMNQKDRRRVLNYKNSSGIARAWYYVVIALTMGSVKEAVAQYDEERSQVVGKVKKYRGRGYAPASKRAATPTLRVDEREEEEDLSLLTAAILAQHQNDLPEDEKDNIVPSADEWVLGEEGLSGKGGDFAGGGAGGSWEDHGINDSHTTTDNSPTQFVTGGYVGGNDSY